VLICKAFLGSLPSIGPRPRADPSVQAVSIQVTITHPPSRRLPLLSARPAVTSQLSLGWYQVMLLGDIGVNNLPKVLC